MKNVDIFALQKRRLENYEREKNNLIVVKVSDGYEVSNINKATVYKVSKNISGLVTCTCKDYYNYRQFNINCKHKLAVSKKAIRNTTPVTISGDINNMKEEFNVNMKQNNPINNNINNTISQENVVDIQTILSKPFPQEIIRYREGQKKKQLAYVETAYYIDRLNESFSHQWNWEILSETVTEHEVYCKGKLTVEIGGKTVVKEAFGGKDLTVVDVWDKQTRQVNGKKPFSIADDLKSASSDALKKACSLLGIGLHLYKPQQLPQRHPVTTTTTVPPAVTTQIKPSATLPSKPSTVNAPQPTGSAQSNNGKGNNGNGKNGGNGKTDIKTIIDKW